MTFKFISKKKDVERAMTQAEERALESIGIFVRGESQSRSPVVTGAYRDSHDYRVEKNKVMVGNSMEYGIWLEIGSNRMKAQHIIENSVMENKSKIQKLVEGQLKFL